MSQSFVHCCCWNICDFYVFVTLCIHEGNVQDRKGILNIMRILVLNKTVIMCLTLCTEPVRMPLFDRNMVKLWEKKINKMMFTSSDVVMKLDSEATYASVVLPYMFHKDYRHTLHALKQINKKSRCSHFPSDYRTVLMVAGADGYNMWKHNFNFTFAWVHKNIIP